MPSAAHAKGLDSRVNEAFRSVFGRNPTGPENGYWLDRVARKEKTTFRALRGAMFYHKAKGRTTGDRGMVSGVSTGAKMLESRINEAFRGVFGRSPTKTENEYWRGRVVRKEKNTFKSVRGAMFYHKARGKTKGSSRVSGTANTSGGQDDKATLIKDTLPLFVKIYGGDPTKAEKAWWRERISCGEITTREQLVSSMVYHQSKKARKGRDTICGAAAGSGGGVISKAIAGIGTHPMGDQVRIAIYKTDGRAMHVTADDKFQVREGRGKILATVGKEDIVQVSWSNGQYHVRGAGLNFDTKNEIRLVPLNMAIMQIKSYSDPSATYPGKNYNRFRGVIEIRKDDARDYLWAINELRTEYYLRGLAETSGSGPEEYLKALGTAARTYVLYHKSVTGGRSLTGGWDIDNTPNDQIYRGYEYEIITPRMASEFAKTKGVLVTDSQADNPVSTVYFSDSDGRTRSAKEKWNTDRFPHLQQSVKDPRHVASTCVGHCVGMSAQGAYGFAKQDGWSWQKILKYYYKSINLVKAY